ncbi:MAG TPA: carboxymuconolactone decarboxylase family protein [Candidatus Baltobacteraceae bacterium]|nr:carboxymuconolactone decarboxylase family protein [Candidatus Baltobacteraceae bacterium]
MEPRLNLFKVAPKGAYEAVAALQRYVNSSGLDHVLLQLVEIRASQINGCAYCIDMHTKDARALGESEQRLYMLNAWRESPFYTDRERAALEWTEALTLVADGHVPDEIYESVKKHFTPEELIKLSLAIAAINTWNRLCIAFRSVPGEYQSQLKPLKASA